MQKEVTIGDKEFLFVEVPVDVDTSKGFAFGYEDGNRLYYYLKNSSNSFDHRHILLPPGSYSILGKGNEIDEATARGIVEKWRGIGFVCYTGECAGYDNAVLSLHSLIRSHSFEPGEVILLLKNKI